MAACPRLAFVVTIRSEPGASDAERSAVAHELSAFLHAHGLVATGGGATTDARFVVEREGSQATDVDRRLVADWARQALPRTQVDVSDLVDLGADGE